MKGRRMLLRRERERGNAYSKTTKMYYKTIKCITISFTTQELQNAIQNYKMEVQDYQLLV